ncbi:MAG: hypothetical protein IPK60_12675 [Sandaracinaceae bacterium]|nr:hypothetical protein [Sandaracinaceae bacterium]
MTDKRSPAASKSIADGAREFVKDVLDAVGELLFPTPPPVPVPVRARGGRRG